MAGPCSAESRDLVMRTAIELSSVGLDAFRAGIWKPRTHPGRLERAGATGLEWLAEVRNRTGLPVGTEVACREHVDAVLKAGLDFVWIGARTTPNPFMVQEIAEALRGTGMKVWVKNPVSQDVALWIGAVERLRECGISDIGLVFRGFSSFMKTVGRNSQQWQQAVEMKTHFPDLQMLCDPSHMAGDSSLVPQMAARAINLGMDGLMVESHCSPDQALSDAAQQLSPSALAELMTGLEIRDGQAGNAAERLAVLRDRIDEIDEELLSLLSARMSVSREIGTLKQEHSMPIIQPQRWEKVLAQVKEKAAALNLPEGFVESVYGLIHDASVSEQK